MADGQDISTKDFAGVFKRFLEQATAQAPADEPFFRRRVRDHFDRDPSELPVVGHDFPATDHPNVQLAVDAYLGEEGRSAELLGMVAGQHMAGFGLTISQLVAPAKTGPFAIEQGPVEHVEVSLEEGRVLTCVQLGLFLVDGAPGRLAVLVSRDRYNRVRVEAMAPQRDAAEEFLGELRRSIRTRNVYRGHVLSLSLDGGGNLNIHFHRLPQIDRGEIILPEGLLDRIERHTVGFARHGEALLAAGRHLKRGMLLHGPPGTGKTLTAMYLASLMPERTVMLLKGLGFGLIQRSCTMARALAPSIVILEDVDLVAEERTRPGQGCAPLLFELLNEMDGLADDTDVIFLLTTNRPDLLEPALAARPGRVDQAIELPEPDEDCRRRLFELYGRGLRLQVGDLQHLVRRTEGASPAFIRELLRKAALFAAEEGDGLAVGDSQLEEALRELIVEGGDLTKSLLGVRGAVGFARVVASSP